MEESSVHLSMGLEFWRYYGALQYVVGLDRDPFSFAGPGKNLPKIGMQLGRSTSLYTEEQKNCLPRQQSLYFVEFDRVDPKEH